MAPTVLSREGDKAQLIAEIQSYQSIKNPITVQLKPLQTLFTRILTYLHDSEDYDDFGDIDDADLVLAEAADASFDTTSTKRKSSSQSFDGSTPKKLKFGEDPAIMPLAENILQRIWEFPHFRLKQQNAIARLVAGGSAVVVFPTGGGKSLVYQIPALAFDEYDILCGRTAGGGVTLVVSPLIALMKVSHFSQL